MHRGAAAHLLDCRVSAPHRAAVFASHRGTLVELRRCAVAGSLQWYHGARVEGDALYENAARRRAARMGPPLGLEGHLL